MALPGGGLQGTGRPGQAERPAGKQQTTGFRAQRAAVCPVLPSLFSRWLDFFLTEIRRAPVSSCHPEPKVLQGDLRRRAGGDARLSSWSCSQLYNHSRAGTEGEL